MKTEKIAFGAGCFWCSQAAMKRIPGVKKITCGYCGGKTKNPTYKQVSLGKTEHVEVVEIEYEKNNLDFNKLLEIFFSIHDPTSIDKQGNDVGSQYRSAIFYTSSEQKKEIDNFIEGKQKNYDKKIVTEVRPLTVFYPAEEYHQDYFKKNPLASYCVFVVKPKVKKAENLLK